MARAVGVVEGGEDSISDPSNDRSVSEWLQEGRQKRLAPCVAAHAAAEAL